MQVYCTHCGYQFQVASQGPVYCPRCGVLLGPAPADSAGGQHARTADPASGMPGIAPPGYAPPAPGYGAPGYPPGYPGVPAPGTVPLPPSSYPSAAGSAPSPYGYSPALAAAAAVAARADRRLRRRSWVLRGVLIILAVLLVAGAGVALLSFARQRQLAQATTTPTPSIKVPDGFLEFSDPGGLFACGVPADWTQVSSASSSLTLAEFGDPAQQTTLSIQYTQANALDEVGADNQALKSLPSGYSGGKVSGKSPTTSQTFGGESWTEEDATLTYSGASGTVTLHVAVLTAIHQAAQGNISTPYAVTLIEIAPAASFATINANDFQAVQSSFVFLS